MGAPRAAPTCENGQVELLVRRRRRVGQRDADAELGRDLAVQVGRVDVARVVVLGGDQDDQVGGELLALVDLDDVADGDVAGPDRDQGALGRLHLLEHAAVGGAVVAVPEEVLVAVLGGRDGQDEDQGQGGRVPRVRGELGRDRDADDDQEVEVRDAPELLEQVDRQERQRRVLGRADHVARVLALLVLQAVVDRDGPRRLPLGLASELQRRRQVGDGQCRRLPDRRRRRRRQHVRFGVRRRQVARGSVAIVHGRISPRRR